MPQEFPQQPGSSDFTLAARTPPPSLQTIANVSTLSVEQRASFMRDVAASQGAMPGHTPCVNCEKTTPSGFEPTQSEFQVPFLPSRQFQAQPQPAISGRDTGGFLLGHGALKFEGGPASAGVIALCSPTRILSGILESFPSTAGGLQPSLTFEPGAEGPTVFFDLSQDLKAGGGKTVSETPDDPKHPDAGGHRTFALPRIGWRLPGTDAPFTDGAGLQFEFGIPKSVVPDNCYYEYINFVTRETTIEVFMAGATAPKAADKPKGDEYQRDRSIDSEGSAKPPTYAHQGVRKDSDGMLYFYKDDTPNITQDALKKAALAAVAAAGGKVDKVVVHVKWTIEAWLMLTCPGPPASTELVWIEKVVQEVIHPYDDKGMPIVGDKATVTHTAVGGGGRKPTPNDQKNLKDSMKGQKPPYDDPGLAGGK